MPLGIWTVESSESIPFSAALCIGTPITGSTVCAATTPARCAAPPAPAMITSSPRPDALDAYSAVSAGVRCADRTRHSCETPKRVRISSAWRIASQSDLLPIMIPTSGVGSAMRLFHHEQQKDTKDTKDTKPSRDTKNKAGVESRYETRCTPARCLARRARPCTDAADFARRLDSTPQD